MHALAGVLRLLFAAAGSAVGVVPRGVVPLAGDRGALVLGAEEGEGAGQGGVGDGGGGGGGVVGLAGGERWDRGLVGLLVVLFVVRVGGWCLRWW